MIHRKILLNKKTRRTAENSARTACFFIGESNNTAMQQGYQGITSGQHCWKYSRNTRVSCSN